MGQWTRSTGLGAAAIICCGLAACGGSVSTASLGLPSAPELPSLPKLDDLAKLPKVHGQYATTPIETYALVARGATSCWFGAGGALRKAYVFYADADPPSSGGKAEIILHERDPAAPTPRGAKAYRIGFSSEADMTKVSPENTKLPTAMAQDIEKDVYRFAGGDLACASAGSLARVAEPVLAQPVVPKGKSKPQAAK